MCLNEEMGSEVLFEDVRGTNERVNYSKFAQISRNT